jgi:hypothetical protein
MIGDERVRFCGQCAKNVYNLSALSREDAEELIHAKDGDLCARMYQRADGTVMTADCPVGARRKRVRRAAVAAVSGGIMATGFLWTQAQGELDYVGDTSEYVPPNPPALVPPANPSIGPTQTLHVGRMVMGHSTRSR